MNTTLLPRILVVDDVFGRRIAGGPNKERANFCASFRLLDITGDDPHPQKIKEPIAQAVFCRGQRPMRANVGDMVENDLEGTLEVIRAGWDRASQPFSLVLLDLSFITGRVTDDSHRNMNGVPEGRPEDTERHTYFGLRLLERIAREFKDLPVYILSAQPRAEVSRQFSNLGAKGFLDKNHISEEELLYIFNRYGLIPDESETVVGQSRAVLLALRAARDAAQNRKNYLIRGERGTGKGLLVDYVDQQRKKLNERRKEEGKLIRVNSPQLSPNLFASALFGIFSGVATNVTARKGIIEEADGGTVYFDEIYDMHTEVQAGILKVLQERRFTPEGSSKSISVDVRFISATNANIEELAHQGKFRSDLLDRLREGGTIHLPPLRDRLDDLPLLVEKYVRVAESAAQREFGRKILPRHVEPEVYERLRQHTWPGNIRELESVIRTAVYENMDVEYLVPRHVELNGSGIHPTAVTVPAAPPTMPIPATPNHLRSHSPASPTALDDLLQSVENFPVLGLSSSDLKEKLPSVERSFARFLARLLKKSLAVTRSHDDDLVLTRAVKLLMGERSPRNPNKNLTASDAADIIKRILGQLERTHREGHSSLSNNDLLTDDDISEAIQTAQKRRPKNGKKDKLPVNGPPPNSKRRGQTES